MHFLDREVLWPAIRGLRSRNYPLKYWVDIHIELILQVRDAARGYYQFDQGGIYITIDV
jgi:hypothetical protein